MKKSILVLLIALFILQPLYANASIAYPDSVLSEPVPYNSQDLSSQRSPSFSRIHLLLFRLLR